MASSGLGGQRTRILMQRHRDTQAAKRFFRKRLKQQGFVSRVIVTDKLKRYQAAKHQMLKSVEHRQHKGLNNQAENSHQPTGARARQVWKLNPSFVTTGKRNLLA